MVVTKRRCLWRRGVCSGAGPEWLALNPRLRRRELGDPVVVQGLGQTLFHNDQVSSPLCFLDCQCTDLYRRYETDVPALWTLVCHEPLQATCFCRRLNGLNFGADRSVFLPRRGGWTSSRMEWRASSAQPQLNQRRGNQAQQRYSHQHAVSRQQRGMCRVGDTTSTESGLQCRFPSIMTSTRPIHLSATGLNFKFRDLQFGKTRRVDRKRWKGT